MRSKLIALCAALLAMGLWPAFAQEKTFELKISHWVPPTHPLQAALEAWAKSVEEASHGTIKST
ncbi:MAG TPA: C4-dicarboxylate ABC transporter, partial [Alphaproteobacteria bacterium]|nr:C4-dicarboxylate ABC transporter [Alphaproteobacteria bacterium]